MKTKTKILAGLFTLVSLLTNAQAHAAKCSFINECGGVTAGGTKWVGPGRGDIIKCTAVGRPNEQGYVACRSTPFYGPPGQSN